MRSERGFTMAETMVAMALFFVISGMAMATLNAALPSVRVDSQVNRVMGFLQYAREMAISRQRDVELRFDVANGSMTLIRMENGVEVPVETMFFEYAVKFNQFQGMGDTPESFGASTPVDFQGASSMTFISDGSFVDETGVPLSGTIFLGIDLKPETARAITVTGTTARARYYKWSPPNQTWLGGWSAR